MIQFSRVTLKNGLKVIINEDDSTPLVAVNLLYNAGSRFEDPDNTGMAHLMEHLMFGGSENAPDFDTPVQLAGGDNNAFTNNDVADYYITIPADNLETALWLEADRMSGLKLTKKSVEVQKKVVIEEFKQRYLNQPYGDSMLIFRPMVYQVHPYSWPTIGKEISHIENVSAAKIKAFYQRFYSPQNAILSVSGNIKTAPVLKLVEKWFEEIPVRELPEVNIPSEPIQSSERFAEVFRDVPSDVIYKAWHVCKRNHGDFHALDLYTDLLAGGESGRLYNRLVRDKKMFSDINTYLTGDIDPGLMILTGKLMEGIEFDEAEKEIAKIIYEEALETVPGYEMEKVKNRFEANHVMANINIMNKATSLSLFELLGDAELINREIEMYTSVDHARLQDAVSKYIIPSNCTTLYYRKRQSKK